ncbi:MAG TPA: M1 family metallopeptidase [Thermoleophilaceae bacterium]|nr:M1 family metallopeptidase [Thermoleophilaceae bacterium]
MPRKPLKSFSMGALLATLALAGSAGGAAAAPRWVAGSAGGGDPYYPLAGNGGYDVRHYSLELDYDRAANRLVGEAEIRARATQNLKRFNLDFRGYEIARLTVNGRRAAYTREGQELTITPRRKLRAGRRFWVEVHYSGTPVPVVDPDESIEGWVPTDDGAFVVNEPQGSPGWYPVNDTPRDKATYDFKVTVAAGHTALANGLLLSHRQRNGKEVWRWREDSPMAPYLATATNGPFETRFRTLPGGLPEYNAVDPDTTALNPDTGEREPNPALAWERLAKQPAILEFFEELIGPYPFSSIGAIVDHAPDVQYALESQTKPNYWRVPSESTLVHEIAHQWFGNSVTLSFWPDIWLNEGFATWAEWIWFERDGDPETPTAAESFDELYALPASDEEAWNPPPGNPGSAANLFHGSIYDRGAMTLQALREKVGDEVFFGILRRWYAQNRDGNVTTADFIALAERRSGQDLDRFFQVWLYEEGKPTSW